KARRSLTPRRDRDARVSTQSRSGAAAEIFPANQVRSRSSHAHRGSSPAATCACDVAACVCRSRREYRGTSVSSERLVSLVERVTACPEGTRIGARHSHDSLRRAENCPPYHCASGFFGKASCSAFYAGAARLISSTDAGLSSAEVSPSFFTKVCGADDAAHDFRVSRFWDVGDEHDFFWGERFAQVVGDTC